MAKPRIAKTEEKKPKKPTTKAQTASPTKPSIVRTVQVKPSTPEAER